MLLRDFMFDFEPARDEQAIQDIMRERNLTHNEAMPVYYEENYKQKCFEYRLQTRCIASMYSRLLGKYKNDKCFRVIIQCAETISWQEIYCPANCMQVQIAFDFSIFKNGVSKREKKIYFLDKLVEGVCKVVESENWDKHIFLDIAEQIRSLGYHNEWFWKKPVKSPNKQLNAQILLIHDVDVIDIYVVIRDKSNNELSRHILVSEKRPDEWVYDEYLGRLEWLSDYEIILRNKSNTNGLRVIINQ